MNAKSCGTKMRKGRFSNSDELKCEEDDLNWSMVEGLSRRTAKQCDGRALPGIDSERRVPQLGVAYTSSVSSALPTTI